MPILHLQKRVVEVGRIRAGDQVPAGEGRRRPRKLVNWRLTSKDKARLDAAAELWGGEVQPWEEREGEWQLYTGTNVLPIALIPGQLPTSWYELWKAGGLERRCDGVTEMGTDSPCMCGENAGAGGKDYCSPHTRFPVMLPDVAGLGAWLLQSNGWNAAHELAGTAEVLQQGMLAGVILPANLRLEQREEKKGGQTRKYAVPVIDIGITLRQMLGDQAFGLPGAAMPAIEAAPEQKTLDPPARVGVAEGVAAVESAALPPATQRANAAEPIGKPIVPPPVQPVPVVDEDSVAATDAEPPVAEAAAASTQADAAPEDPGPADSGTPDAGDDGAAAAAGAADDPAQPPAQGYTEDRKTKKLTKPQKDKLNVLYGKLRQVPVDNDGNPIGNPRVTIGGLYAWAARERNVDVELMIDAMNESITFDNSQLESAEDTPETLARDAEGRLHFGPLRDRLTRDEASKMIDGMEKMDKEGGDG